LSVILSVVLAGLLILGEPALATTVENELPFCATSLSESLSEHCILESGAEYPLIAKTGYKIKRTDVEPDDECYGETIYAKFNFKTPIFEETYPIQDNWELHFNTPLSGYNTGTLTLESDKLCKLEVYPDQTVELLSGFKTKEEFEANEPPSGHFVIAKDYYAFEKGEKNDCNAEGDHEDDDGNCYKKLGSLTGVTGQNFPALGGAVVGQIIIKPNAIRAPHWHLQFAEAGYCYGGIGQVGVIVPSNTIPKSAGDPDFYQEKIVEEMFVKENEIFLFPEGSQHYLRNIGNDDFKCTLFFTEGTPLNGDQLLTITLQNIVGNTPVGVLNPVFVAGDGSQDSTIKNISDSPAQTFSSADQGPDVIPVVEACSGEDPNIDNPGCPAQLEEPEVFKFGFSPYSEFEP